MIIVQKPNISNKDEAAVLKEIKRLGYRLYRNPLLMMFVGPTLVFLFDRRFPQKGMTRPILFSAALPYGLNGSSCSGSV